MSKSLGNTVGLLEDDYSIQATTSPEQALKLLETYEFDLVIADQRMPGMTGVELLTIAHQRCPETVRIIVSAYSDSKELLDCINQGRVFRYVLKPWNPDELEGVIQQALERRYQRVAIRRLVDELGKRNDRLTKALAELKEAQNQLIDSARLATIGQLTTSIAHEVRNQLTVVRAAYDFISEENLSEDLKEMIRLGDLAFTNLADMLRSVNSFAKQRPWEIDANTADLRQIVSDSVLMAKMDARAKHRTVLFHEPAHPVCARVDSLRVGQVVVNLLRNALDATGPEGRSRSRCVMRTRSGSLRLWTMGRGFPKGICPSCLTPSFRPKTVVLGWGWLFVYR